MSTELLKKVYLFANLEMDELIELLNICERENFEAGKFIILETEAGDKCYIVEMGMVKITKFIPGGGEEELAKLGPGSYFGEMALIDGSLRSATAVAAEDTTCLVIKKADLDRLMASNKDIGNKLLTTFCRTLSRRLRETNEKISKFIAMTSGFGGPV